MSELDRKFVRNIALIVVAMIVFVIVLAQATGRGQEKMLPQELPSANQEADLIARIEPVGQVYAGDTGRAALAAAQAAVPAEVVAAFGGALDGAVIYDSVCAVCHKIGAGGAPLMEASAWTERLTQGTDVLVKHAIDGYQGSAGLMPAKGGRMDLTDEQVEVAVTYMLDNLQ